VKPEHQKDAGGKPLLQPEFAMRIRIASAHQGFGKPMRNTVLSLIVAFIAAIACFVLVPIIGLELLRIALPRLIVDDTLGWMLIFAGPSLFGLLLTITITIGFVAFFVSKAMLPDRGWRSPQTLVILLTFAVTVVAAALITWPFFITIEQPEAGPQQNGLPSLRLARTLKAAGDRSGTVDLAWSTDGERLASYGYGETGIATWSPDGKYEKVSHIYRDSLGEHLLHYLSGHRLLITSPFAEANSAEERRKLADIAFSVVDAEVGRVVRNIPGPHPGGRPPENTAIDLALSPDERFAAVISSHQKTTVNIYSTDDWKQVATIDLNTGEKDENLDPQGFEFSPDGKTLAILHGLKGKIKFYKVESWAISGSIVTYSDPFSPMHAVTLSALSYSPDGAMIAVGASSGGSWWPPQNGLIRIPGSGMMKVEFPADPLRVYRVSDGKLIASLGSFPGGIPRHGLVWSPNGEYLAFQDARGDIRFWNPFRPGLSVNVARKSKKYSNLLFSSDGSQLAANFSDGLKVFDVVPPAK
jgi:WD40 repeat protein